MNLSELDTLIKDALQDNNVVYTDAQRLAYIADGVRAVALVKPEAVAARETVTLVAGTIQTLPSGAIKLLRVTRNINADNSPGRSIHPAINEITEDSYESFGITIAATQVFEYVYQDSSPDVYEVFPPVAAGTKIEIVYAKVPTITGDVSNGTVDINNIYAPAIVNWALHRAWTRDHERSPNYMKGQAKLNEFYNMFGIKGAAEKRTSPKEQSDG